MEHEVSFLYSLEPATCSYLPDQSTTCLPSHCWSIISVLSSHLCPCLPSVLLLLCFPTKALHAPLPCLLYIPLNSFFFISLPNFSEQYRSWSSPLCSLLHSPVTSYLKPKYFLQHPILQ